MDVHQYMWAELSEIPSRLEQLRVGTTPTNDAANEPTPANVLNVTIADSSFNNISSTSVSPAPSPDEMIIRQRGRRNISVTWSPSVSSSTTNRPSFEKTPTKPASAMILRSSPRKRQLVDISFYSPDKGITASSPRRPFPYYSAKKLKLEDVPIARLNKEAPLSVLLKGLSQDQLIEIIESLTKDEPKLEEQVRSELPMPDISPMEEKLIQIKRNIFKSLPTSRLVKKTDSAAYSKAAIHLANLKKLIVNQSRLLYDSMHWDGLLNYVSVAWNCVRATPIWDNNSHNMCRRQCFKVLAWHCNVALQNCGSLLTDQRLLELEKEFKEMSKDSEDMSPCLNEVEKFIQKSDAMV